MTANTFAQESAPVTPAPELPPTSTHQFPALRPKPPDDSNKESSSFIGDPENLDPLRARRENLKDDNEPVLDDIKQVLDAPSKKKIIKKVAKSKRQAKPSQPSVELSADEPDVQIEKRFYQNYLKYNMTPTSAESWSTATFGRSAEIYIVQKGDTLWTISETLFGDSLFWPKIWAINRQGILNPHFITPGMQVNFYPGSNVDAPTLGLGADQSSTPVVLEEKSDSTDSTPEPPEELSDKKSANSGQVKSGVKRVTHLPPSIPVYRSGLYFGKAQKIQIIDLEEPEKIPLTYSTDIILTDRLVLSDIKIESESHLTLSCYKGELIEKFKFIRQVKTKEYAILQPLEKISLDQNQFLYPYQRVGTLTSYDNGKLKIKDCNSYLNGDQIFVPIEIIDGLKTNKTSVASAKILGGPTVVYQQQFAPSQTVYVDMGSTNFDVGQLFGVKSRRIDQGVGQIKILDRFGSYAVAVIIDSQNSIQVGDPILQQSF